MEKVVRMAVRSAAAAAAEKATTLQKEGNQLRLSLPEEQDAAVM